MCTAALFTIVKICRQPKCPSVDNWMKKKWHIYKMEYYSAIKMNVILLFVTTWIDLDETVLSEISQTEKGKYYIILLICGILKQNK